MTVQRARSNDGPECVCEGKVVVRRVVEDLQPGDLVQHYSTQEQTYGDPIRREVVAVEFDPPGPRPRARVVVTWRDPSGWREDYATRHTQGVAMDAILRSARERNADVPMPFDGDYEKAFEWCQGQNGEDHGGPHAAMVDLLFTPPEDYDDPWMKRLWEVGEFVRKQPCKCTPDMVEDHRECERCRLLNVENAGR